MAKLLPVILAVIGLLGGAAAGYFLKPSSQGATDAAHQEAGDADAHAPAPAKDDHGGADHVAAGHGDEDHGATPEGAVDYVKLNNQFVVPVVDNGRVSALVVLSMSLEVESGASASVYDREPKLRDAFLRVLFDHANAGGFRGSFTDSANMATLRMALREAAKHILGPKVSDVLIVDMMRQDT